MYCCTLSGSLPFGNLTGDSLFTSWSGGLQNLEIKKCNTYLCTIL